jgi:hypothetical protein
MRRSNERRESAPGPKPTCSDIKLTAAYGSKADVGESSNRAGGPARAVMLPAICGRYMVTKAQQKGGESPVPFTQPVCRTIRTTRTGPCTTAPRSARLYGDLQTNRLENRWFWSITVMGPVELDPSPSRMGKFGHSNLGERWIPVPLPPPRPLSPTILRRLCGEDL